MEQTGGGQKEDEPFMGLGVPLNSCLTGKKKIILVYFVAKNMDKLLKVHLFPPPP